MGYPHDCTEEFNEEIGGAFRPKMLISGHAQEVTIWGQLSDLSSSSRFLAVIPKNIHL
jgi:hypothetical protein